MVVVAVVPVTSLRLVAAGEQHYAKASRTAFGVGLRVVHASATRFFVGAIRNKYVRRDCVQGFCALRILSVIVEPLRYLNFTSGLLRCRTW